MPASCRLHTPTASTTTIRATKFPPTTATATMTARTRIVTARIARCRTVSSRAFVSNQPGNTDTASTGADTINSHVNGNANTNSGNATNSGDIEADKGSGEVNVNGSVDPVANSKEQESDKKSSDSGDDSNGETSIYKLKSSFFKYLYYYTMCQIPIAAGISIYVATSPSSMDTKARLIGVFCTMLIVLAQYGLSHWWVNSYITDVILLPARRVRIVLMGGFSPVHKEYPLESILPPYAATGLKADDLKVRCVRVAKDAEGRYMPTGDTDVWNLSNFASIYDDESDRAQLFEDLKYANLKSKQRADLGHLRD